MLGETRRRIILSRCLRASTSLYRTSDFTWSRIAEFLILFGEMASQPTIAGDKQNPENSRVRTRF